MKFRPLAHVSGFICIRKYLFAHKRSIHTYPTKTQTLKPQTFENLSRVELFENATNPDTRGRTATGFEIE
jgi:hypothetical protein